MAKNVVLILVLMEWRWNFSNQLKSFNMAVLILVLMEWRWNTTSIIIFYKFV